MGIANGYGNHINGVSILQFCDNCNINGDINRDHNHGRNHIRGDPDHSINHDIGTGEHNIIRCCQHDNNIHRKLVG
jgi:hypothetical protein